MNTSSNALDELEAMWRALNLMFRMTNFAPVGQEQIVGTTEMLNVVAKQLGEQTGAQQVLVALGKGDGHMTVLWGEEVGSQPANAVEFSPEEVAESKHLRVPIWVGAEVAGVLDLRIESGPREFFTQHKKLLSAVANLLSLLADREALFESFRFLKSNKQELVDLSVNHYRWHGMLHETWRITEQHDQSLKNLCERVVHVVSHGIPCDAVCLSVRDSEERHLTTVFDGLDRDAVNKLNELVNANWADSCDGRGFRSFAFRRVEEAQRMNPLQMALMMPLSRLVTTRGILALGRIRNKPEFTTADRHALEIVAGLVNQTNL